MTSIKCFKYSHVERKQKTKRIQKLNAWLGSISWVPSENRLVRGFRWFVQLTLFDQAHRCFHSFSGTFLSFVRCYEQQYCNGELRKWPNSLRLWSNYIHPSRCAQITTNEIFRFLDWSWYVRSKCHTDTKMRNVNNTTKQPCQRSLFDDLWIGIFCTQSGAGFFHSVFHNFLDFIVWNARRRRRFSGFNEVSFRFFFLKD